MTALDTSFKPSLLIRHPHAQTVIQSVLGRGPLKGRMERLVTPDSDFVEILWVGQGKGPIVILLPGLGGSAWSPYATGMANTLAERGYRVAVLHARGCGTQPNRLHTAFHSGQTEDLRFFVSQLVERQRPVSLFAIGFSLGANVLLKYLAESPDSPVQKAFAISPPLDLAGCAKRLKVGTSRFYQRYLLDGLHRMLSEKRCRMDIDSTLWINDRLVAGLNTIEAYDDHVTAPLHGFGTKERYYAECSSGPLLGMITTRTTILASIDDPFLDSTQYQRLPNLPSNLRLRVTGYGGHVGFIQSISATGKLQSWAEKEVLNFLGYAASGSEISS